MNTVISGNIEQNNQRTETEFMEQKSTFQLDYTRPFLKKFTLETGAQYVINDVGNDFAVLDLVGNEWIVDEGLTNNFDYSQNVLGVYVT